MGGPFLASRGGSNLASVEDRVALAYLPSPSSGVWDLGPFPVRAYALAIILGVVAAVVIGERRWVARGGTKGLERINPTPARFRQPGGATAAAGVAAN